MFDKTEAFTETDFAKWDSMFPGVEFGDKYNSWSGVLSPCRNGLCCQYFGEACCLHLQGQNELAGGANGSWQVAVIIGNTARF
jgi:hypothetical protein